MHILQKVPFTYMPCVHLNPRDPAHRSLSDDISFFSFWECKSSLWSCCWESLAAWWLPMLYNRLSPDLLVKPNGLLSDRGGKKRHPFPDLTICFSLSFHHRQTTFFSWNSPLVRTQKSIQSKYHWKNISSCIFNHTSLCMIHCGEACLLSRRLFSFLVKNYSNILKYNKDKRFRQGCMQSLLFLSLYFNICKFSLAIPDFFTEKKYLRILSLLRTDEWYVHDI